MVFSSPTFLFAFLPAVLLGTWLLPGRVRNGFLVGASLLFYVWGAQEFVVVVVVSSLADWRLARAIDRARTGGHGARARRLLRVAVAQNLLLLGYFKYASFGIEQVSSLTSRLGLGEIGVLAVALPIGISFFTFSKISYVVDVYRGEVPPVRSPVDMLVFILLFPHAIAGPIVRLRDIQDQLSQRRFDAAMASDGAVRFGHGLAKKVLIADTIAPLANAAFTHAEHGSLSTGLAWLGALAYTMQLYYDFSGYCDMAIGIAMMLGFRFPENFDRPYSAVSITDFWRRWHMTLSRWFRDYVYIGLGGNRRSPGRVSANLIVVFLLTGLWHGAHWAFIAWGAYHGAWLLVERRLGLRNLDLPTRRPVARRFTTLLIVLVGWVTFRAEDLGLALHYYRAMAVPGDLALPDDAANILSGPAGVVLIAASLAAIVPSGRAGGRWLAEAISRPGVAARTATLLLILPLALTWTLTTGFSPFLYFRF